MCVCVGWWGIEHALDTSCSTTAAASAAAVPGLHAGSLHNIYMQSSNVTHLDHAVGQRACRIALCAARQQRRQCNTGRFLLCSSGSLSSSSTWLAHRKTTFSTKERHASAPRSLCWPARVSRCSLCSETAAAPARHWTLLALQRRQPQQRQHLACTQELQWAPHRGWTLQRLCLVGRRASGGWGTCVPSHMCECCCC